MQHQDGNTAFTHDALQSSCHEIQSDGRLDTEKRLHLNRQGVMFNQSNNKKINPSSMAHARANKKETNLNDKYN